MSGFALTAACGAIDWSAFRFETPAPEVVAAGLITALADGDIDMAMAMFADEIRSAMSEVQVREMWPRLILANGDYVGVAEIEVSATDNGHVASVTCEFERGPIRFETDINSEGKVTRFERRYQRR